MMSPSSPPDPSGDLRVSDADRERVAEALRRHHVDGRIDTDELQERLERCYAARTSGDLAELLADLPDDRPARPARPWDIPARRTLAAAVLVALLAFATVGALAHGHHHPGPLPFLAVLLLLKLAWGRPRRRGTAWGARG
jgi:uncharacterized protein DUF1707